MSAARWGIARGRNACPAKPCDKSEAGKFRAVFFAVLGESIPVRYCGGRMGPMGPGKRMEPVLSRVIYGCKCDISRGHGARDGL